MSASPRRHRRLVLTLTVALIATVMPVLAAGPAGADPAAPAATLPAPVVTPSTITAGTLATVSGTRCRAGDTTRVYVTLLDAGGTTVASVQTAPKANGAWTTQLTPPAGASAGSYTVAATCDRYTSEVRYTATPVTVTASTTAPWTGQTPDVPDVPNGSLADVDCVSATACTAVGDSLVDGEDAPLVETWDGATWSVATVTGPADAQTGSLAGVSCPATGTCVAVGQAITAAGYAPLVAVSSGGSWTTSVLAPPRTQHEAALSDVSCSTATTCVAVGSAGHLGFGSGITPVAYRLSGGSWRLTATPVRATGQSGLDAVSCSSVRACVAVGSDFSNYPGVPTAQSFDGTAWTAMTLPAGPDGSTYDLADVDCAAAGQCTAVGSTASGTAPFVETLDGTTWTAQTVGAAAGFQSRLTAVSCLDADRCTAVGVTTAYPTPPSLPGVVVSRSGGTWSTSTVGLGSSGTIGFAGVSCPSGAGCDVVGDRGGLPLAALGSGDTWADRQAVAPHGFVGGEFDAVACSSAGACTAGGFVQDPTRATTPFVNRWNGQTWTRQALPDVGAGQISGVACPSAVLCYAVGRLDLPNYQFAPLLLQWRTGTWRQVAVTAPSGGSGVLTHVSCSSATACLAVGQDSPYSGTPFAVGLTGTRWTATAAPPVGDLQYLTMTGVSCVTGGCHAVATGYAQAGGQQSRDLLWDGTAWSAGPSTPLVGEISCTALTSCAATPAPYSDGVPQVAVLRGTRWTTEPLAYPGAGGSTLFGGIACRAGLDCVVVGSAASGPYVGRRVDGTWVQQPVTPQPSSELHGVACAAAGVCVAVGGQEVPVIVVSPSA